MKTGSDKKGVSLSRRRFLANTSALSATELLGLPWRAGAEPPPEIPKILLVKNPAICLAPEYLAEELLRLEGFAEVEYGRVGSTPPVCRSALYSLLLPPFGLGSVTRFDHAPL